MDWVQEMSKNATYKNLICPSSSLRSAITRRDYDDPDHLFSSILDAGALEEMLCLYSKQDRCFRMVTRLGQSCCGYPATLHGGMTAALFDESFGGMFFSLVRQGLVAGPGFTARLEVDYKQKIQAGSLLLVTITLDSAEGRKVWMSGTVQQQPGGPVLAQARCLFVIPKGASGGKALVEAVAKGLVDEQHPDR